MGWPKCMGLRMQNTRRHSRQWGGAGTLAVLASVWVLCRQEGDRELSVELAVCKLLMGDTAAAEAAVGLGPDASNPPDADIHDFIKVHLNQRLRYPFLSIGAGNPSTKELEDGHRHPDTWRRRAHQ